MAFLFKKLFVHIKKKNVRKCEKCIGGVSQTICFVFLFPFFFNFRTQTNMQKKKKNMDAHVTEFVKNAGVASSNMTFIEYDNKYLKSVSLCLFFYFSIGFHVFFFCMHFHARIKIQNSILICVLFSQVMIF